MAFKTSISTIGGVYLNNDYQWVNAHSNTANGYDANTVPGSETKITASDVASGDFFGSSVAVGSSRIVVGANGNDDSGADSGSAYIFDLDGTQLAKITASDAAAGDQFGRSVAIGSGRIVVGAPFDDDYSTNSGSFYIFDLDGTQLTKINAGFVDSDSNDLFGWSVAVGDNRIVVGAYGDEGGNTNTGSAYIFDLEGTQLAKIIANDAADNDNFGWSVAVGSGRIVIGAYGDDDGGSASGSAYIFDLDGTQVSKITASDAATDDYFGRAVAVGSGRICVGAYGDDDNGTSSGSAYIFDLEGTQLAKIKASDGAANDRFGNSVAIGSGRIVVGATGDDDDGSSSGSAYVFDLDGTQIAKITASDGAANDFFGSSVAAGSGKIVIGTPGFVFATSSSAYIYETPKNSKHLLDLLG